MSQDGAHGRLVGHSLAGGRYQLKDLLGAGGMASVYLAHDTALDRQVAIKTLLAELGRQESFRERFKREAKAVARLSHTNIVSVFDTGEDIVDGDPVPYIVMEYVAGRPLGSVLREDVTRLGAMPAEKALRITADVLAALEASHEMGLVHRDIKPGNVMVTDRGAVKVMDFGIARAMQSGVTAMTQTGMVVGTPQYLSPEQALGRPVDARADLYSVGVMLFQLLTGRLPFDADSPLAIAYAHVQEEPVAPSTVNTSLTPAMDGLVLRALRKNPDERFPSAAAMGEEAARVIASAGAAAAPVITPGAPPSSGAGVASAVFPPVDATRAPGTPPPTAAGAGATAPQGVFGAATTPMHAGAAHASAPQPGYGYPQAPAGYGPPGAPVPGVGPYATDPGTSGQGPGAARGRRRTYLISAVALVVAAVVGTLAYIGSSGSGGDTDAAASDAAGGTASTAPSQPGAAGAAPSQPAPSASASDGRGSFVAPDPERTIPADTCTDPHTDSENPALIDTPDLRNNDLESVEACLRAAGWRFHEVRRPSDAPQDQVIDQNPAAGAPIDPKAATFTLIVSTGTTDE